MIKRALPAVLALVSLGVPVSLHAADPLAAGGSETVAIEGALKTGELDPGRAVSLHLPDVYASLNGPALINGLPMMALLDGRRFPITSELGRMGMTPVELGPIAFLSPVAGSKAPASRSSRSRSEALDKDFAMRPNPIYTGGEVGVFYGRSTGRYGGDEFGTYVIGEVATDRFQITAGASYQESTWRAPRR